MEQPPMASMWSVERRKMNLKAYVSGDRFKALQSVQREGLDTLQRSRERSASLPDQDELLHPAHPETSKKANELLYDFLTHKEEQRDQKLHLKLRQQEQAETATTLASMALSYKKEGRHDESLDLYNECLRLRVELHGENHADTAIAAQNIGLTYYSEQKWQHASIFFGRAHKIRQKLFGDKDKLTKKSKKCWQESINRINDPKPDCTAGAAKDKKELPTQSAKKESAYKVAAVALAAHHGDTLTLRTSQRRASLPLNLLGAAARGRA